jgi:hypothetical protein
MPFGNLRISIIQDRCMPDILLLLMFRVYQVELISTEL